MPLPAIMCRRVLRLLNWKPMNYARRIQQHPGYLLEQKDGLFCLIQIDEKRHVSSISFVFFLYSCLAYWPWLLLTYGHAIFGLLQLLLCFVLILKNKGKMSIGTLLFWGILQGEWNNVYCIKIHLRFPIENKNQIKWGDHISVLLSWRTVDH